MNDQELQRSWKTLREMMHDRGHTDVPEFSSVSPEDIVGAMGGRYAFHIDAPSIRHRIVYELSSKFKSSNVKKLLDAPDIDVVIVVVREQPTSTSLKGLESSGKELHFFNITELQFNVSRHDFVPPHEPIRDERVIDAIVHEFQVRSKFQFPLILSTDPMARYLGLKHGQLVKVTRASPSSGHYTLYRCCTKA